MWVSRYICIFVAYSFLGWVYETLFCTIKGRKWENRGFLYGPVCPIYGFGAAALIAIDNALGPAGGGLQIWQIYVISVVGSAILEFVTSWGLEKLFHASWWDYSNLPLNVNGRISLLTSLGFGVAGLLVVYVLAPITNGVMAAVSPLAAECLALLSTALLMIDLTLTVNALLHFDRLVTRVETRLNETMETFVDNTIRKTESIKQDISARQKSVDERINQFGALGRQAIRRVSTFRYNRDEGEKAEKLRQAIRAYQKKRKQKTSTEGK